MAQKLREMEEKLDKIYISTEKTRVYFKWTMIISVVVVVLPLIGLLFVVPLFLGSISNLENGSDINKTLDSLGL